MTPLACRWIDGCVWMMNNLEIRLPNQSFFFRIMHSIAIAIDCMLISTDTYLRTHSSLRPSISLSLEREKRQQSTIGVHPYFKQSRLKKQGPPDHRGLPFLQKPSSFVLRICKSLCRPQDHGPTIYSRSLPRALRQRLA